ncbi:MAG: hypothetical protein H6R10_3219 [Rhodocyclaceae bacterium]|nr:hypothetical protein [Rhodocyclaceae bacterium]
MDAKRVFRHLALTPWQVSRTFPASSLAAVERAIAAGEGTHTGELRFVIEGALPTWPLLRGQSARQRAIEIFSRLRVWDTEHNSGVLIYLLLADRAVEIVADRGVHGKLGEEAWERICQQMETAFRQGKYEAGAIAGIEMVNGWLAEHYPARGPRLDELPNRPLVL